MAFDFSGSLKDFDQVVSVVGDDLKTVKTGRAKPSLIEDLPVEAYGTRMPLKELGSISASDAQLLTVQIWDQSVVGAVEKALMAGGFNPASEGQLIRVAIAPLTGEKREELVKTVHQKIESGKQMLRQVRTETKREIEAQEDTGGVSEDDIKKDLEQLEKLTKEYTVKLEEMGQQKETELRTL